MHLRVVFLIILDDSDNFLKSKVKVKVAQLCLSTCNPIDYTVPGILQARILKCSLSLLQGIFSSQGANLSLPYRRQIPAEPQGKPPKGDEP